MTTQQIKTKKLLKEIGNLTGERIPWIFIACMIAVVMLIASFLPISRLKDANYSAAIVWTVAAVFVGKIYLLPYRSYNTKEGRCKVLDTIQYLPIDFKDVRTVKIHSLLKIYGLLLPLTLLFQFVGCAICAEPFQWTTVIGVFLYSFVIPVIFNLITI